MNYNTLIPELTVMNIERTKEFYLDTLGFQLEYERIEEKFIFLSYHGSQMMFEQYHEDGWNIGEMAPPLGRGINFSIDSPNIEDLYQRVLENKLNVYRTMKVTPYNNGEKVIQQKEFLLQDPDGYLLRFINEE